MYRLLYLRNNILFCYLKGAKGAAVGIIQDIQPNE